ncbi:MAG: aspartyl/glutamyl-tRNA(Asn/Gln) amidotransferase, B subunit [Parcubacteria bacterium C7867-007]|nr:MAG: aspartyl/glutamyl-tRNA(Asn/Gln) amidotransferase, B subunit [Parcubacteria bacterium C7867-007]
MSDTSAYRTTIGLEIHAELATKTKMFCDSPNDPEETRPNVNVCPVCLAHPGTLPVPNRDAIYNVLRVGKALGATLADYSEFDRKSYFYPDIPKGYQISQYEYPFVAGGELAGVAITRVHLEEDTARSSHSAGKSLVDFNRAGVPLMELVTEPVIHDAETAGKFARELQLLLRTLGVSHANLEKGEMRIEANISVSKTDTFGTKVEVKNLNSFRSVERAIEYEVERQIKLIEEGGTLQQETRGWDETKQVTFHQRIKEGSADYRYFPEPDIPKIYRSRIPEWTDEALKESLPELPWEKRARYIAFGMKEEDAAYVANDLGRAAFFDAVIALLGDEKNVRAYAINYFVSDLAGIYANADSEVRITPESFAALIRMITANKLSSRGAKDALAFMATEGGDPEAIAEAHGLMQVSDTGALTAAVQSVITANEGVAAEYRAGKESSLQFLVGQAMKATKGAGNPALIKELLIAELGK